MAMYICYSCGTSVRAGDPHKCSPQTFNVVTKKPYNAYPMPYTVFEPKTVRIKRKGE